MRSRGSLFSSRRLSQADVSLKHTSLNKLNRQDRTDAYCVCIRQEKSVAQSADERQKVLVPKYTSAIYSSYQALRGRIRDMQVNLQAFLNLLLHQPCDIYWHQVMRAYICGMQTICPSSTRKCDHTTALSFVYQAM